MSKDDKISWLIVGALGLVFMALLAIASLQAFAVAIFSIFVLVLMFGFIVIIACLALPNPKWFIGTFFVEGIIAVLLYLYINQTVLGEFVKKLFTKG